MVMTSRPLGRLVINLAVLLSGVSLDCLSQAPAQAEPGPAASVRACSPWSAGDRTGATEISDGVVVQRDFAAGIPVYASLSRSTAKSGGRALTIPDNLAESMVRIETQGSPGSGVIIAADGRTLTVLTAAHVTQNSRETEITVQTFDGENHAVRSIHVFPGSDLAELKVASSRCYKAIPLVRGLESDLFSRSRKTSVKEDVFILGFPAGTSSLRLVAAEAVMQSYGQQSRAGGYAIMYRYGASGQTEVGMSGGPVLDTNGYLVGIHGQVDRIGRSVLDISVRTGYGLAVPVNLWINARTRNAYTERRRTAVDDALVGAYQLSTGDLDQSIKSLSRAIEASIQEHRALTQQRSEAYRREVVEPLGNALSAEADCKRQQAHQQQMAGLFGSSPYTSLPRSSDQLRQEYEWCVRSRRSVEEIARRQRQREMTERNATEQSMAQDGSQQHLYMLRSLAYGAKGLSREARQDQHRCRQLAGRRGAEICELPREN